MRYLIMKEPGVEEVLVWDAKIKILYRLVDGETSVLAFNLDQLNRFRPMVQVEKETNTTPKGFTPTSEKGPT